MTIGSLSQCITIVGLALRGEVVNLAEEVDQLDGTSKERSPDCGNRLHEAYQFN